MKTIKTLVYSFNELNDKAKERARQWWREGFEFDHEPTFEDAKQCLALAGFAIDRIFYSGFSSQGDGACFEGTWVPANVKPQAMREHAPKDKTLHRIADECARLAALVPQATLRVKHRGHYYHAYCTEFDIDLAGDALRDVEQNPNSTVGEVVAKWETIEKELIEVSRDAMEWIYQQLEKDYDWHMEDEQVDESIRANEYTFTAEGKRFG